MIPGEEQLRADMAILQRRANWLDARIAEGEANHHAMREHKIERGAMVRVIWFMEEYLKPLRLKAARSKSCE